MDRGFEIKDMLVGNETPDEIMDLIRDTFESLLVPEVGEFQAEPSVFAEKGS